MGVRDGKTSAATNAANTYTNAGAYTVTLTAVGSGGTNALTRTNYIVVTILPQSQISRAVRPTARPIAVSFTNLSTGATNFTWVLGDGTPVSPPILPRPTRTSGSTRSRSLLSACGTNSLSRTNYIVVTNPPPVANFTAVLLTAQPIGGYLHQSEHSATNYTWDFGTARPALHQCATPTPTQARTPSSSRLLAPAAPMP